MRMAIWSSSPSLSIAFRSDGLKILVGEETEEASKHRHNHVPNLLCTSTHAMQGGSHEAEFPSRWVPDWKNLRDVHHTDADMEFRVRLDHPTDLSHSFVMCDQMIDHLVIPKKITQQHD